MMSQMQDELPLLHEFVVTAGSIIGREHVRIHRNNQDGVALHVEDEWIVGVVADGCSSSRYSEVGARLGAAWIVAHLPRLLDVASPETSLDRVSEELLDYLASVAKGLDPEHVVSPAVVGDFLLFTFLVAVVTRKKSLIFGLGDGVFSANGHVSVLDSGRDNAPRYLSYRLVPSSVDPHFREGVSPDRDASLEVSLRPRLHFEAQTSEVESLIIGTDGVADLIDRSEDSDSEDGLPTQLQQFEQDPLYLRNPTLVHKRLVTLGETQRRLADDTTVVLIRRRPSGPASW